MTEQKKAKLMGGAVLAVAIVTLFGIVYAAFTQNLRINGSATTVATSWDIRIENLRPTESGDVVGLKTGTAVQLGQPPAVAEDGLSISDYSVSLTSPGDSISYIFDVHNYGNYDARLDKLGVQDSNNSNSYVWPTLHCEEEIDNNSVTNSETAEVCSHLTYTLKYYENGAATTSVSVNDSLSAGSTVSMILTLTYTDFTTELNNIISVINSYSQQMDAIINDGTMTSQEKDDAIDTLRNGIDSDSTIPAGEKTNISNYIDAYYAGINGDPSYTTPQQRADARSSLKSSRIQSYQSTYAGKLPTHDVNVSNLGFSIIYAQNGNAHVN